MTSVRRALAFSGVKVYLSTFIGIVTTMVLARLLSPAEVGVMSVAAGQLAMVSMFRDCGVSSYLVREPDLTPAKLETCLGITLIMSWILAAGVAAGAQPIGSFYGDLRIANVMYVQSACLMIIPFNALHLSLLKRERRFDQLLYVDVTSGVVNGATGILLALAGASYMALAWGTFCSIIVTGILVHIFSQYKSWITPRISEWREIVSFGGKSTALSVISNFSSSIPDLIVAKAMGIHYAGVLSRAFGVQRLIDKLIAGAVDPVVFSVVSQKLRDGAELASGYLRAVRYMSVVAMPISFVVMCMAPQIVDVMFGPSWRESADLLRSLTVAGMAMPIHAFNSAYFIASGGIGTHLAVHSVAAPLKAGCWLLVIWFDLTTVAMIWSVLHFIHGVVSTSILARRIGIPGMDVVKAMASGIPVLVASGVVPAAIAFSSVDHHMTNLVALVMAGLGAGVLWLLAIFLTKHPFYTEVAMVPAWLARGVRLARAKFPTIG